MWRRHREAASAGLSTAPYSAHHGLYSEAVVSSVASAVALAEVGRFRETVQYLQKAAKALYEAAREVFEKVKVTVQRFVELFVEAVTRVLAWIDEHKAYLFLMAAAAAGVVALSAALNLWGLVELDKLAYAASLPPFVVAGVKEYSREEAFKILREAPDPYEKFREVAKAAVAKNEKLAEPWESLRVLIMPKKSEEKRLMSGWGAELYSRYAADERMKKGLFYAVLALAEAFGVYRSALGEYVAKKVVQRVEVGEEPFKRVMYMPDLGLLTQLSEKEEAAFEDALRILRVRLNEYAVKYNLRDLLDVNEDVARRLAEAEAPELPEFSGVSFGTKAYAALVAYREYALGRRGVSGKAAWYWLEVGGSAWLLYYAPWTAYEKAEGAGVVRPVAVEELVAEALRRLFLKPGANHYRGLVEELTKGGKLALMFEKETESSYVFRLYNMKEGGKLDELGISLKISKVGEGEKAGITYTLIFDMERWREFFKPELEVAMKAAEEVGGRLPVEDSLLYMLGWVDSDVAITRNREGERVLRMTTSHLWQLAETHALFGWSRVIELRVNLTLEGPKLAVEVETPLEKLDDAIRISAEGGWLKMLGTRAGLEDIKHVKSWDELKRWVAGHWGEVIDAVKKQLKSVEVGSGFDLAGALRELEGLKSRLDDDKIAREVIAPALLLIQAERLGVDETTLRYFAAVASGAIGGDGSVSAAEGKVVSASGKHTVALHWGAVLAAYGIDAEVKKVGRDASQVVASGGGAVRLAGLYFLYGPPLLEGGDERVINHKLAGAVELGAEGLSVGWEGLRRTEGGRVAADLTISVGGVAARYNVYLRENAIELNFQSKNRSRVELAARLLRLAGVDAELERDSSRNVWRVYAYTDVLASASEELRAAHANIVRRAVKHGWVDEEKARRWLEKLEGSVAAWEGKKFMVGLSGSGALVVSFRSTSRESVEEVVREFKAMGLEEGVHFAVRWGGGRGRVYLLAEGVRRLAWLSRHGEGEQRRRAAEFLKFLEEKARAKGGEVFRKLEALVEEGRSRGALRLVGLEKDGVKVLDVKTEEKDDKLYVTIKAEVDGAAGEYKITLYRERRGIRYLRFYVRGEEAVARAVKLIEVLTGERPIAVEMPDGRTMIKGSGRYIDALAQYEELREAIERWSNR
ncbi:MAG: PaRep2b protein [Pyrobaculum sp.]